MKREKIDFFNQEAVNFLKNKNYTVLGIINLTSELHMRIKDNKSGGIFYRYTNLLGTDRSGSDEEQWDYQIKSKTLN